jgi:YhcH/YjgK/YiaL family protein
MILDYIDNWKCYSKGNLSIWQEAFDFIASVTAETEETKYTIQGDSFFAFVQGYETHSIENGKIEAHRDYIDIHSLITGSELVHYSSLASLELFEDFTPKSDDLLYLFNPATANSFQLYPGRFALFFPEEGHMTRVQTGPNPERIKKVVLKIAKELL